MEIAPDQALAHHVHAHLNSARGDVLGIIASCGRALELDPNSVETMKLLAMAYRKLGDTKMLGVVMDRIARQAAAHDPSALEFLATLALDCGHRKKAREYSEAALNIAADSTVGHLTAARLDLMDGLFESARNHVQIVLERRPRDRDASALWAAMPSDPSRRPGPWLRFQGRLSLRGIDEATIAQSCVFCALLLSIVGLDLAQGESWLGSWMYGLLLVAYFVGRLLARRLRHIVQIGTTRTVYESMPRGSVL